MDIDTLKGLMDSPLFKGLTDKEVTNLMHQVQYRVQTLERGEVFFLAGDPCRHANIVIGGEMSAKLVGPSGRIIRMDMHHAGQMLAPAFLFASDGHYPVTVEAEQESRVLRLAPSDLQTLIHADTRVAMNFVRILSNNIAFLTKKVGVLSMTVREKVGAYLRNEYAAQQVNPIFVKMSRQQLADGFGIQKYSLQRCLREMQAQGAIRIEGKHIHLNDIKLL
ncbi:MAG: Crp/Fnr family transcriptional regulator [Prevotella sp.]|nr:Crp/Fnr family transcriptional regulator [Prevotella sp.]